MACKTQIWSRVTGFFRPVSDWNKGKSEEFKDRKRYENNVTGGNNGKDIRGN
jgi:ribonucleoside-triphosphate reductase